MSSHTPRHTKNKVAKVKERILKVAREKQRIIYKGIPIRLSANFSVETLQARKEWHDIFNVLKGKNLQPRTFFPARLSFNIEEERKTLSVKQKLKEFINTKPALKEMLKCFI